jgi:transposase
LQTSDAIGAAAVQLGAQVIALVVVLNKQLGLSFGKIVTLLQQLYGLTVTRSGLVHTVHRAARQARPTYEALCTRVRGSPMVSPDETGWKVAGLLQWLWAFATRDTTIYRIQPGRGFDEAAAVLGSDFGGVLVRDGWAPYRQFAEAAHQTCLAHLLRRCRLLRTDYPRARFVSDVQHVLHKALALRDRYRAGTISTHGVAVARGHLIARLNDRLAQPVPSQTSNDLVDTSRVSFPPSGASSSTRRSTPRIGEPSRHSGRSSSRAKSVVGIGRGVAPTVNKSWRV